MTSLQYVSSRPAQHLFWTGVFLCMWFAVANAQMSPSVQRGTTFAQAHCATCHSIDKVTPSPLSLAPPFRVLHTRYKVDTLAEALAEGIMAGHSANMPEFRLDPGQIGDFLDFLKTLE